MVTPLPSPISLYHNLSFHHAPLTPSSLSFSLTERNMAVASVILFLNIREYQTSISIFERQFPKMVAIFFLVLGLVALNQTHFPPRGWSQMSSNDNRRASTFNQGTTCVSSAPLSGFQFNPNRLLKVLANPLWGILLFLIPVRRPSPAFQTWKWAVLHQHTSACGRQPEGGGGGLGGGGGHAGRLQRNQVHRLRVVAWHCEQDGLAAASCAC